MKITIDIDAKEIAELRALALPEERLVDSISAPTKKQLVDEIVGDITDAVKSATNYRTTP